MILSELTKTYGPWALITGASSGIGKAFAGILAQAGFNLVLVARRVDLLQTLAKELHASTGIKVTVLQADLGELEDVQQLVKVCQEINIGLLVNNAGFSVKGEFASLESDVIANIIAVNCQAPALLAQGLIPQLIQRERSGIIFTSSVEAFIGCPYSAIYSASKALIKNLGEALWVELAPHGVDVLTLCPGATDTEGLARSGVNKESLQHVLPAQEVARLVLENIQSGPVFISSEHYKKVFEQITSIPRDQALLAMAKSMKP